MEAEHYATYVTATAAQGCVQNACVGPATHNAWPTQINITCQLCKKEHGFVHASSMIVGTPNLKRRFMEHVEKLGLQRVETW